MSNRQDPILTTRMREVLAGIAQGKKNHEIGDSLGISPKTVEKHRNKLFSAFAVDNAVSLVVAAIRAKIIEV